MTADTAGLAARRHKTHMSTFNGLPIVTLPVYPASPRSIEWQFGDVIGQSTSPFSLQKQMFDWQASRLRASLSYPKLNNAEAAPWRAFLASLRGTQAVFLFGDPLNEGPQELGATGGTVIGSGQTGYTLLTSGSGLTPGDWFSLGVRLYTVTSVSGGTLGIWPQIRESPVDGTDVVITNTQGLFRLSKNDRTMTVDEQRNYDITLEIEEAI
jgi:hypothetical protein